MVKCIICFKNDKYLSSLRRHVKTHDAVSKQYTCPECLSNFGRMDNFRRHAMSKHNNKDLQPVRFNPRATAKAPILKRGWEVTGVINNTKTNRPGTSNNSNAESATKFTIRMWQAATQVKTCRPTQHTFDDRDHLHGESTTISLSASSSDDTICQDEREEKNITMKEVDDLIFQQIQKINRLLQSFKSTQILKEDLSLSESSDSD